MRVGVLRFPGSRCDHDAVDTVAGALARRGLDAVVVWHESKALGRVDAAVAPTGFDAGAPVVVSPILPALSEFAAAGGPVLGICNGFALLCAAGLLEGELVREGNARAPMRDVHVVVEGRPTPFTQAIPAGRHLRMSVSHGEGSYHHEDVARLESEGRVVFRYCTDDGEVSDEANPNASLANIAGVCNHAGNVVGMLPHPERACVARPGCTGEQGLSLFDSVLAWQLGTPARVGG